MSEATDALSADDVIKMNLQWHEVVDLWNRGKITSGTIVELLDWYNLR